MWVFAGLNSRLKEGRIDLNKDGHVSACFDLFVSLDFGYFLLVVFCAFEYSMGIRRMSLFFVHFSVFS